MAISDLPDADALFQKYLGGATVVALEVKYEVSHHSIYKRLRIVPTFRQHCEARRQEGAELRPTRGRPPTRSVHHGP